MTDTAVVILAAGEGTRMKSGTVKVLHPICGRPLVYYPAALAKKLKPSRVAIVVGRQRELVQAGLEAEFGKGAFSFPVQDKPLGTGHAVGCAAPAMKGFRGDVVILYGDTPRLSVGLMRHFIAGHRRSKAALSAMTAHFPEPAGYGRIVRDEQGEFIRIVEKRDCTAEELAISEVNLGIYCVDSRLLFAGISKLGSSNDQGEFYLTDLVEIARSGGKKVRAAIIEDPSEVAGINDRWELAAVEKLMRRDLVSGLARSGVSFADPDQVLVDTGITVGNDTRIGMGVGLYGKTKVGQGCMIEAGCQITDSTIADGVLVRANCVLNSVRIHKEAQVGPFAHLRGDSVVGEKAIVGNFVEVVRTRMGRGSRAGHLSYLGDAKVGRDANIGAGTITCNFDGKQKQATVIGAGAFIGSGSQLVAPVRIGKNAVIGAGSTITRDVPGGALGLSRTTQKVSRKKK